MKNGWENPAIGDVCKVIGGGTPAKNRAEFYRGDIPWATIRDMRGDWLRETEFKISKAAISSSATHLIPAGSVLVATRVGLGKVSRISQDTAINQDIRAIIPLNANQLDQQYLFYWFKSIAELIKSEGKGATVKGVTLPFIKSLRIPLPALKEQQRIVVILDEAFAGIATAKANAERNLRNARDVFDSLLISQLAEKVSLGDLVAIRTGKLDANAAVEGGIYPFFTCAREAYAINNYAFDCEAILLAGNNAVGDFNVKHYRGKFNAYQRTYVITVKDERRLLYRFLYYQMLKSLKRFKEQSVGAGTKFLKLGMIKELEISLPSIEDQARAVSVLDAVLKESQRLESIYTRKLTALDELKQSLLHQAFSGQL